MRAPAIEPDLSTQSSAMTSTGFCILHGADDDRMRGVGLKRTQRHFVCSTLTAVSDRPQYVLFVPCTQSPAFSELNNRAVTQKFELPKHFDLPPFFTIQPVLETQKKQSSLWGELILNYCERCCWRACVRAFATATATRVSRRVSQVVRTKCST
jgi:hypothetical protein